MKCRFLIYTFAFVLLPIVIAKADNHLVYLRFDDATNNISEIKQQLDKIEDATTGRFILFYDNKVYNRNEFNVLCTSKLFLTNLSIYEPMDENAVLNNLVNDLLIEYIDDRGLIMGRNDSKWNMTFIMPENSSKIDLIRWLETNNFEQRDVRMSFWLFDVETSFKQLDLISFLNNASYNLNY